MMHDPTTPFTPPTTDGILTHQLLQSMIDASDHVMAYCEAIWEDGQVADFVYRLANQAVYRLVGQPAERVLGNRMTILFPSIKSVGLFERYAQVIETGQAQAFEFAYQADGYNGWYQITASPLSQGFTLLIADITDRKRAHEEKQQQADEFRQILDNALTAISHFTAVRDESGQIIDFTYRSFNKASEDITGRQASEIIGRQMLELFPGVRSSGVFDGWLRLMETGGHVRFQNQYSFDGFDFWYDTQAVKWGDGFIQSYMDITPIKQAELDRQQQADFLTLLLQTSPGGIIAYDAIREPADAGTSGTIRDFRTIFFNAAYEQIFGDPADVIQNRTFRQRFEQEGLFEFYVQLTETGQAIRREHYYAHLDKWLDVAGAKLPNGFLAVVNDITARKQAEQQRQRQADALEQANRQLARSNESLQQFAYVASHDLQEPLRKIQSFGGILQERYAPALGDEGADIVDRMKSAAARMSGLIKDLLNYSRLTTQMPAFQAQRLGQIIDGVLITLEMVVNEKRAVIEVGELGTVLGDATQLAQLVQNLLSNALKFSRTDESGRPVPPHIRISSQLVDQTELPSAFDSADTRTEYRLIRVSDNGIGFDPHQAERIFGAFQRLHSPRQYPGTGIGLAIVRKVIDNHRGYIVADSRVGQGATFTVYLPTGHAPGVIS